MINDVTFKGFTYFTLTVASSQKTLSHKNTITSPHKMFLKTFFILNIDTGFNQSTNTVHCIETMYVENNTFSVV